jgi:hypothetical protein
MESLVGRQDLLGPERQPAAELELAAHPQPRRGGQWRSGHDCRLQVPANRRGQPVQFGLGEPGRRRRLGQLAADVGRN